MSEGETKQKATKKRTDKGSSGQGGLFDYEGSVTYSTKLEELQNVREKGKSIFNKVGSNTAYSEKDLDLADKFTEGKEDERALDVLKKHSLSAAKILVSLMESEESSNSLKADLAKEVLTRVYGKVFSENSELSLSDMIPDFLKEFSL